MRLSRSLLSVALGALLLTGVSCDSSPTGPDESGLLSFESLARSTDGTLAQGQYGGYDLSERQNLVFETQEQLTSFWEALYSNTTATPAMPEVDFAGNTRVVAVLFGTKRSGGYDIEVEDVERSGDQATVHVTETVPGESCAVTTALTSPYHVVEVTGAPAGGFTFETERQTNSCQ